MKLTVNLKKSLVAILVLTLVFCSTLIFFGSFKPVRSQAQEDLPKIFIYNHDGKQQGITIAGVPKYPGNLESAQNNLTGYGAFFDNFLYNGLPAHRTLQSASEYMSTTYNLGGYTYIVNTSRLTPFPGDVMYFKKGFTPIYGSNPSGSYGKTDHALHNVSLIYDRYYVFDGYKYIQTNVLKNLNTSANFVVANDTLQLTPAFLPIEFYKSDVDGKTDMWDEEEVAKLGLAAHQKTKLSKTIAYTSSNTSIATVDANGVVTGIKAGKVTITGIHEDSNEQMSTEIYVRPSAAAVTPTVSYTGGKILIGSGTVSSAVPNVAIADNAFFSQINVNGASLTGTEAVSLGADGVVSITKSLAENDIIHLATGWQPITSADGSTVTFVDASLAKDKYYQIKQGSLQEINVFSLPSATLNMNTREVKDIAPTFVEGISDRDIVWTSSADYMVGVNNSGKLSAKNYVSGADNKYKSNSFSPCTADQFPKATITATHKATGYSQTMEVSVVETIEAMKVEVTLIANSPQNIGVNFVGMESGRKISSDMMQNIESKWGFLNPGDGRGGENWNRNNDFFAKNYLNGNLMTNSSYGANGALFTFTHSRNRPDYALSIDIQRAFSKNDVIFFQKGFRPFTYRDNYGYFYDSMELKGDMVYRLIDGKFVAESSLVFGKNSYSILTGSKEQASVTKSSVLWENAAVNTDVTYSIKNESIATVNSTGEITAVSEGQTEIIATNGAGLTTSSIVYVFDAPQIELGGNLSLGINDSFDLTVSTNNLGGKFEFTSSDEGIVKVDSSNKNTAAITAVAYGTATITVSYNDGELEDTITVRVGPNLTFTNENNVSKLYVNRTARFTVSTTSTDTTIRLASSDESVATIDSTGFVTAIAKGETTISAISTVNENSDIYTTVSYNITVEDYDVLSISRLTHDINKLVVNYDKARSDLVKTDGLHTVAYTATAYDDYNLFFNKIVIQEVGSKALPLFEYAYGEGTKRVEFDEANKPSNEIRNVAINGDTTYFELVFGDGTNITNGTKITFLRGFTPLYGNNTGNYYGKNTIDKEISYVYEDGVWIVFIPEGGNFSVVRISDYKNSIVTMTFNVKTTKEALGENISSSSKILINGYTMDQINAVDSNGVIARHIGYDIAFKLKEDITISGKKIFDFSRDNLLTIKLLAGYTMPSSYVAGADYEKSYYVDEKSWSNPLQKFENDTKLEVSNVSHLNSAGTQTVTIAFKNTEKVFNSLSSEYVNSVPQWLLTTSVKDQLDHQISSGAKYASWYGIYINGKSIYDYMFKSGATSVENQSKTIVVNYDYANNALVLVFNKEQSTITKIDWTKEVSIVLKSEIFKTDIGATFSDDTKYLFTPSNSTWARGYIYTLDVANTLTVEAGKTVQISATLTSNPIGGSTAIKYTTSNPDIAIVDANGVVTGISAGEVKITVTAPDSSISKEITLTVTEAVAVVTPKKGCRSSANGALAIVMSMIVLAGVLLVVAKKAKTKKTK